MRRATYPWVIMAGTLIACGPSPTPTPPAITTPDPPAPAPDKPARTVQIALERDAACARRSDGSVWCWGDIFDGFSAHAVRVKDLPPARDVAVADEQGCIVAEADGSVWCWGREVSPEDRTDDPSKPRRIAALPPATRVVMWQGEHARRMMDDKRARACALTDQGELWCWRGTDAAVRVGGKGATDIAMGERQVCVLRDGTHHCATLSVKGISKLEAMTFAQPLTTVGFAGVSRCGHLAHGALHCWGIMCGHTADPDGCDVGTSSGELTSVDGGLDRLLVSSSSGLDDYVFVNERYGVKHQHEDVSFGPVAAAGAWYACGVTTEANETKCWGNPRIGPPAFKRLRPFARLDVPIHQRYRVPVHKAVAIGREAMCGAGDDGQLRCWLPARLSRELGVIPQQRAFGLVLPGTQGALRTHFGHHNLCVALPGKPVRCLNQQRGSTMNWQASTMAMHGPSSCGIFPPDGELRCRLGTHEHTTMEDASGPFTGAEKLSVRGYEVCATRSGQLYCNDSYARRMKAVDGLPTGVQEVAVGEGFKCALIEGQVWCWGQGQHGQLGRGVRRGDQKPAPVPGLAGVQQVRAAFQHACAVDGGGQLHCWGGNMYGQLGTGTRMSRARPGPVAGISGVVSVHLDDAMTCVARSDDTICWGQGAWMALDERAANNPYAVRPPTRVEGIGERAPPAPTVETVEVSLP